MKRYTLLSFFLAAFLLLLGSANCWSAGDPLVISLSGAPVTTADLVTADFNGDGSKEIVAAGSDGMLYVISWISAENWQVVWSRQCNQDILAALPYGTIAAKTTNSIEASPIIADLDKDGKLEIVVAMGGDIHKEDWNDRGNGGILVYKYMSQWNFSLSGDWPQPKIDEVGNHCPANNPGCGLLGFSYSDNLWDGIMTVPAAGDLDGDGDLEIVIAGIDRRIHAYHHDGTVMEGWPIYRGNGDALLRGGKSSPALGDIDNDGLVEVIVGTMSPPWAGEGTTPDYSRSTIWAINGDSSNVPGWPVATEQYIDSSPSLADIDDDGYLEVIVGVRQKAFGGLPGRENIVYMFNHDGTIASNWPFVTAGPMTAPPAIADIDNDDQLEVLIGCGWTGGWDTCGSGTAKLYAINGNGTVVPGFPTEVESPTSWLDGSHSMPFSPVVTDIDGDSNNEIIIVQLQSQGVSIVNSNGTLDSQRSLTDQQGSLMAAPVVDDTDGDGFLEILAGGGTTLTPNDVETGKVFIWSESGAASSKKPWPMNRHNTARTAEHPRSFIAIPPPPPPGPIKGLPFLFLLLDV